jgi:hypothetical protein
MGVTSLTVRICDFSKSRRHRGRLAHANETAYIAPDKTGNSPEGCKEWGSGHV